MWAESGLPIDKKKVQRVINVIFNCLFIAIIYGDRIETCGFGIFTIRTGKAGKELANRVDIDTENQLIHKKCG